MKKPIIMLLSVGMFAFASCNKTEKTDSDTAVVMNNDGLADDEAMYRDRAAQVTSQMARDLQFDADTNLQREVQNVYVTRTTRRTEARNRFATDTTGMHAEMRTIDLETDKEFQRILKPEQYRVYETNRTTYYGGFDDSDFNRSTSASAGTGTLPADAKVTTKTEKDGDTKTEIETANTETKIKRDADGESKTKITTPNSKTVIKTDADGTTKTKTTEK